jgi:hypothetical protein
MASAGVTVAPRPDVRFVDAAMVPTLARQICADLANLRLDPVVAGSVMLHVPLAEREKAAILLFRDHTAAALAILSRAIETGRSDHRSCPGRG